MKRVKLNSRKGRRSNPNIELFTARHVQRLPLIKADDEHAQYVYWDDGSKQDKEGVGQIGLSILVGRKTRSYRSTFTIKGTTKPITRQIGRVGEMTLAAARAQVAKDRDKAARGIDPRVEEAEMSQRFEDVVKEFIEKRCKPRQRTWKQTERILLTNCKPWLNRTIGSITMKDAEVLLDSFGERDFKKRITLAWLRTLWRWCWKRGVVAEAIMDKVEFELDLNNRSRDRVFSDDEIKAIWKAADNLDDVSKAYFKALLLTVPRKSALAMMKRGDVQEIEGLTTWVTPNEHTKSFKRRTDRVYLTPLVPFALRILDTQLKDAKNERVFPGLHQQPGQKLKRRLVVHGAPADFSYHAARHTLASWLQGKGYSEYERGLVLNHSESGSVTSGYSHSYPLALKARLLQEWADHVEGLVTPKGTALLRG